VRKSRLPRTAAVAVIEIEGRRWVVCVNGNPMGPQPLAVAVEVASQVVTIGSIGGDRDLPDMAPESIRRGRSVPRHRRGGRTGGRPGSHGLASLGTAPCSRLSAQTPSGSRLASWRCTVRWPVL
jgi:hypothetical protein